MRGSEAPLQFTRDHGRPCLLAGKRLQRTNIILRPRTQLQRFLRHRCYPCSKVVNESASHCNALDTPRIEGDLNARDEKNRRGGTLVSRDSLHAVSTLPAFRRARAAVTTPRGPPHVPSRVAVRTPSTMAT